MNLAEVEGAIEAVLFAAGSPVKMNILAEACGVNTDTLKKIVNVMNDKYEAGARGLIIKKLEDKYQMGTNEKYSDHIRFGLKLDKPQKLSQTLLETLAIIACMQPVTKQQIMEIRGVDAGHAVNRLMERDLICEMGRLDAPGKPILFGTSEEFLRTFGFSKADELPETMRMMEGELGD